MKAVLAITALAFVLPSSGAENPPGPGAWKKCSIKAERDNLCANEPQYPTNTIPTCSEAANVVDSTDAKCADGWTLQADGQGGNQPTNQKKCQESQLLQENLPAKKDEKCIAAQTAEKECREVPDQPCYEKKMAVCINETAKATCHKGEQTTEITYNTGCKLDKTNLVVVKGRTIAQEDTSD